MFFGLTLSEKSTIINDNVAAVHKNTSQNVAGEQLHNIVTYKSLKMRRSFIMKLYDTGVYLQNGKEIIRQLKPSFLFPEKMQQEIPLPILF